MGRKRGFKADRSRYPSNTTMGQNPAIRERVVAVLREYGNMTINEIVVALDLTRGVVELALRLAPEVKRVGGIGAGCHGYRYGVVR